VPDDVTYDDLAACFRGILLRVLKGSAAPNERAALSDLGQHIRRHCDSARATAVSRLADVPADRMEHASDSARAIMFAVTLKLPNDDVEAAVGLCREGLGISAGFSTEGLREALDEPLTKLLLRLAAAADRAEEGEASPDETLREEAEAWREHGIRTLSDPPAADGPDEGRPPGDRGPDPGAQSLRRALARLLSPAPPRPTPRDREDLERLQTFVEVAREAGDRAKRQALEESPWLPETELREAVDTAKVVFLVGCMELGSGSLEGVARLFRGDLGLSPGFKLRPREELADDMLLDLTLQDLNEHAVRIIEERGEREVRRALAREARGRRRPRRGQVG
jgi:hypothetical protein